jgi:hypothetical protein
MIFQEPASFQITKLAGFCRIVLRLITLFYEINIQKRVTLPCVLLENALSLRSGFRTALEQWRSRNLSSEALSNERVGYYPTDQYSPDWDKDFSRTEHRSLQAERNKF